MTDHLSTVTNFAAMLAILAMLAVSYGWLKRTIGDERWAQTLLGALFGIVALLEMAMPITLQTGVIVDLRAIPIALAGAFLGWRGTLTCVLIALAVRINIGGPGMSAGIYVILSTALAGLVWARLTRDRRPHTLRSLVLLGLMVNVNHFAILFLPDPIAGFVLRNVTLPLALCFVVFTPLIARLIDAQNVAIWGERMLRASATTDPRTGLMTPEAFERAAAHVAADDASTQGTGLVLIRVRHARWIREVHHDDALDVVLGALRVRMEDRIGASGFMAGVKVSGLAAFLPDTNADRVATMTARLANEMAARPVRLPNGDELRVSLDIGTAWATGHKPLEELMEDAAKDLEQASRIGPEFLNPERRGLRDMLFDRATQRMTS